MPFVADLTIAALEGHGLTPLPGYAAALRAAEDAAPPPFGTRWYGDEFRRLARDPQWLAGSLISNAEVEGDGARKLWAIAAHAGDADTVAQVRGHAEDESRHAMYYLAMLDQVFPIAVGGGATTALRGLSPRLTPTAPLPERAAVAPDYLLDELVQMNLGEIRTRIHQLLMRPVIAAHADAAVRPAVDRVMATLLTDETRHIGYTAVLIERAIDAGWGPRVAELTRRRLAEFNAITAQQVGDHDFTGE